MKPPADVKSPGGLLFVYTYKKNRATHRMTRYNDEDYNYKV